MCPAPSQCRRVPSPPSGHGRAPRKWTLRPGPERIQSFLRAANSGSASQGVGRRVRDRRQKKCLVGKGRSVPLGTLGDRDPPSRLGALPTSSIPVHSLAEGRSQNASAFCPAPLPVAPAQAVSPGDRVNGGECQGAQVRHQQGQRHHFKKGKLNR